MIFGIQIIFVLILPWLIFARDDYERHLWPSVQSVSALIKRYEGALRFVTRRSRTDVTGMSAGIRLPDKLTIKT